MATQVFCIVAHQDTPTHVTGRGYVVRSGVCDDAGIISLPYPYQHARIVKHYVSRSRAQKYADAYNALPGKETP